MRSDIQVLQANAYQAFAAGSFAEALVCLEQLEQQIGLHAELANNLAVVHYKLGNLESALKLFRKALALQGEAEHLVANNLLDILEQQQCPLPILPEPYSAASPEPVGPVEIPNSAPEVVLPALVCPVCKQPDVQFLPIPPFYCENARLHGFVHYGKGEMTAHDSYSCSRCGSSDRERLYVYWLEQEIAADRLREGSRAIHFAPEAAMSRLIRGSQFFEYSTADLAMQGVDFQVDLMDIPFADSSCDFFICSHVLEHVPDDGRAVRELCRITRAGGCGILMAPIIVGLQHTLEDSTVTDEADRWRLYGQNDHVRLYAHDDYVRKIESNGFRVEQLGIDYFGAEVFAALGLKSTSILYIARK